uniref:Uncharacterized protein n=1 Tax=Tanacetum cinerariifolium TaxID=118510 RepID=A0A6L2N384_TANCI|nr:hypothetical protein [Tanacetum cinerariifolium]
MFTQRIVIQERVEDLQLGVESYQKKINLTRPDTYRLDLKRMTPYTAYPDIQGIIYEDEMNRNRLMRTDALYKFSDSTLNHAHEETILSMQDVTDADGKEVTKEIVEVITTSKIIIDEVSTAGNILKAANEEPVSAALINITIAQPNKGKVKLVEEPKVLKSKKAQIAIDEKVARRIEAEWNTDIKDNIDWNEVVEQVQSRQSDALKKYQALKKKPVSVAQARKNMMIYLKNMAGFKMEFFKGISYEEIRPLFEEEYNKVQTLFKEGLKIDAERIIASRKRTRKEKLEEQHEAEEFKRNLEIVPDDEDDVFMNVTPLSSKPLTIVDYKIYKEGKKEYFQIIRANSNHQMYLAFSIMLKNFDREDLDILWKIVKDKVKESQLNEVLDVFLWHTLKVMFEHTVEDSV